MHQNMIKKIFLNMDVSAAAIGRRLRLCRVKRKLSLEDLGGLVERSGKAAQQWEAGDSLPSLGVLCAVAEVVGSNPVWLVTGIDCVRNLGSAQADAAPWRDIVDVSAAGVGARIRKHRLDRGLTLVAAGRLVGKSGQGIQHWEVGNNEGKPEQISELCKALDADPIKVLFGVEYDVDEMPRPLTGSTREQGLRLVVRAAAAAAEPVAQRVVNSIRGRPIPVVDGMETVAGVKAIAEPSAGAKTKIVTHFECSPEAFAFEVRDRPGAAKLPNGTLVVVDPFEPLKFGSWVLAYSGDVVALGQLIRDELQPGAFLDRQLVDHSPILLHRNWPSLFHYYPTVLPLVRRWPCVIGVVVECTLRGSALCGDES